MAQRESENWWEGADHVRMPRPGRCLALAVTAFALATGLVVLLLVHDLSAGEDSTHGVLWSTAIVALLLAGSLAFLRFLLHRSCAQARSVEVVAQSRSDSAKGNAAPELDGIATDLRAELAQVSFASSSPIPGGATSQHFIDDVRGATASASSSWGMLLASLLALSRSRPSPFRVTLRLDERRPTSGQGGDTLLVEMSSQLTQDTHTARFPLGGDSSHPLERAASLRRAACHVAAYVLPHTRLAKNPPWKPWHRRPVNPEVFYDFAEARRLVDLGRYEEALECFERAAAKDPCNPYIRLEKAAALKQLGLYLDALAVYFDVVTMEGARDRAVWKRHRKLFGAELTSFERPRRFLRDGHPNGPEALQLARYRMVHALVDPERLARDWIERKRRDPGDAAVRSLRPLLEPYANALLAAYDLPEPPCRAHEVEADEALLARTLQFMAVLEARALTRDYRPGAWSRLRNPFGPHPCVLQTSPLWAEIRFRHLEERDPLPRALESRLPPSTSPGRAGRRGRRRREPGGTAAHPPKLCAKLWILGDPPRDLESYPDSLVRALEPSLRGARRRRTRWMEHYNAACTLAVGMNELARVAREERRLHGQGAQGPLRQQPWHAGFHERRARAADAAFLQLARLAVHQLGQAVMAPGSQLASGRAPWLAWGDHDLDALRVTQEYQVFVQRYLPRTSTVPPLPRDVVSLVSSNHFLRLVEGYARLRESYWRRGGVVGQGGRPGDTEELRDEIRHWALLRDFCEDPTSWRPRFALIQRARESFPDFEATMPNPEDDRLWKEASQTVSARPSEERPTTENSGDRGSQILPRADVSGARCPERLDRLSDLSEEWIGRRRRTLTRTCLRSQRVLGVLEALDEKASLPGSLHRLSARIDENAARELATLWARVARDAARVLGERVEGEIDRAREDRRASAA